MRLLKIGRDASCDIVLYSDKVSSLHAELTLMNSGDILLEDKGSHNGTFIQNQAIKPGKPVNVRRGDAIRFADVELQWSQVPMPEDNSAYRAIYGIGSHFNNDIQISGGTVSRYHATIKVGKDNKVYIIDHSKNGTTVDGQKITPHNPYRIKKSSAVVCGGVPVNLKNTPVQWPSEAWKTILMAAASVMIVLGVGFGIYKFLASGKTSLNALQKATACVAGQYYIELRYKDDPFIGKINGWPEKWVFGVPKNATSFRLALGTLTNTDIQPISYTGTAFFISKDGELGTNRHIACPWEYLSNDDKEVIRQTMEKFLNSRNAFLVKVLVGAVQAGSVSVDDANAWLTRLQKSDYEISGSFEYLGIALTGTNITTKADLSACQVIAESGDEEKDVALLRLNSKKTPEDIVKGGFFDIQEARTDEMSLMPQEDELTTIGYPSQYGIALTEKIGKGSELQPTVHRTYISKTPNDNQFQIQSNVVGGQSGSPIIDKDHRLVGVVWGSHRGTEVAYGCNIKHLKEMYDKYKARN
jgi:pSer/pThr/pTyr-binding forkhead associated (FHA) protein